MLHPRGNYCRRSTRGRTDVTNEIFSNQTTKYFAFAQTRKKL